MSSSKVFALICGCHLLLSASEAGAKIAPPSMAELVEGSDLIVLARVDSVSGRPSAPDRRAKATVTEVWKGPKTATVAFDASPSWTCDIADAKPGETVLLFLGKKKGAGWIIVASGRGRMPLLTLDGKTYASPFADVILPPGTPSIAAGAGSSAGFDRAVELDALRDLVRKVIGAKK